MHQDDRSGRGRFKLYSNEVVVVVSTIGLELPATREQQVPARAPVPVQASAIHNWSLPDWGDYYEPWILELRGFTFDVGASALHVDVREPSPDPNRPDFTDHMLSLDRVVSFATSVRYPRSASDAERIQKAYVDGCTFYMHHPVVTLSAMVAAQ